MNSGASFPHDIALLESPMAELTKKFLQQHREFYFPEVLGIEEQSQFVDALTLLDALRYYITDHYDKVKDHGELRNLALGVASNAASCLTCLHFETRLRVMSKLNLLQLGLFHVREWLFQNHAAISTARNYTNAWSLAFAEENFRNYSIEARQWLDMPGHANEDELAKATQAYLLKYCAEKRETTWTLQTTLTNTTCLYKVAHSLLELELPDFLIYMHQLLNETRHEHDYKRLSAEALEEKLKCPDGKLLTTLKLQEAVLCKYQEIHKDETMMPDTANLKQLYHLMLAGFPAFMGNRPQDFAVGYGEENAVAINGSGKAWYDPVKFELHYENAGKNKKSHPKRVISVPMPLRGFIALYREAWEAQNNPKKMLSLLPPVQNFKQPVDGMRRHLKEALKWLELCPVNHNLLRHLFETHCMYYKKMPADKFEETLHGIGHSKSVSTRRYSQLYRGVVAHPLGYNYDFDQDDVDDVTNGMHFLDLNVPDDETDTEPTDVDTSTEEADA